MLDPIPELIGLIDSNKKIALFTGAGISTESGIPDFRSPGGLWEKNKPIDFRDLMASEEMRKESWRRKINLGSSFNQAKPNRGHRAIAELFQNGKGLAVITQNIDNLHQDSGINPDRVIELHGNATYATCLDCHKRYEIDPIIEDFKKDERLPICNVCEGIIKTATISFGQAMPEEAMMRAQEAALACDLFIAIGSSLVVYPAAGFPAIAKQNGATLVILNRDPTDLDPIADLVINKEIGETLGEAVGVK
ncbi:MAG: Sir2 family NAD-dependent protein deacetylase [Candidatus Hydrogenedentota bacterium]